jgi:ubiquinone/menaquinone biosynthesis C-methylase UbiE
MAKKLPPSFEEREAFLLRIMSTDQNALRLRQFIEQALCHLEATGDIREGERAADVALGTARSMAHKAIKNRPPQSEVKDG